MQVAGWNLLTQTVQAKLATSETSLRSGQVNQSSCSCTTTTIRIHGWMQHCQRVTPAGRSGVPAVGPGSVLPASTNWFEPLSGCGTSEAAGKTLGHWGGGGGL